MPDYSVLKQKISDIAYDGMSDADIAADLNAKTIAVKAPIPTSKIKAYLQIIDKRLAIMDSTLSAGRNAEVALKDFKIFDMADPLYVNRLNEILDSLVDSSLITTQDKTAILSIGDSTVSWADQNWSGDVTLTDIQNAKEYL